MRRFAPFADDSDAVEIEGLKLEDGQDCIACYGSLDLTQDKAGLALARQIQSLLVSAVQALKANPNLPTTTPPPKWRDVVESLF